MKCLSPYSYAIRSFAVASLTAAMLTLNISITTFQPTFALADFNIDAVGDWGCNSNTKNTVKGIQGKSPEQILALGDYSYQPTATCWLNTVSPIKSKTHINIGNHENDANEDLSKYLSSFGLGKQYYSFEYQNVHILTMATEVSFGTGSSQYNFVKNDLQTASQNPNIKWIIVDFHRVMYTSPNTCSASTCKGSSSLRDAYHPLFDQYGVDLVLQAHVHNYQRTYPLKYNPSSHSSPIKTSTSTSSYSDPPGEIFATVGTGGINFHGLSSKASFVVTQQASKFGFFDIKITNGGSKLEGKYFTNDGTTKDQFTITKSGGSQIGYHYEPNFSLSGSNYYDVNSTSELQISKFSVAGWFKTSTDYISDAFVVNKGGLGSENTGQNTNYGIWLNSAERVKTGFETATGIDNYATTPSSYRDGNWHYAVGTYDGSTVRLYIDGIQVATKSTSASPDNSGSQPVRVGANSRELGNFFNGNADEIRVWNRALTSQEVANAYAGTFNTSGQVLYLPSSSSITSLKTSSEPTIKIPIGNITSLTSAALKNANDTHSSENAGARLSSDQNRNNLMSESLPKNNMTGTSEKTSNQGGIGKLAANNENRNTESKTSVPDLTEQNLNNKLKNIPPRAYAGKNQITEEGSQVLLDGSKSNDGDGKIDLYYWQQIRGPKISIVNSNDSKATFISPPVNRDTTFVFKLTVTDNKGATNSGIVNVKIVQRQGSFPGSIPDDNSVKDEDITNSTGR